jgi:2-dehydropantoate 2-reductase
MERWGRNIMRLLIYGAGVIGSTYAVYFSKAGHDVSVYARGKRLEELETKGLRYPEKGKIRKADVRILAKLADDDIYDFIFLTVRENQLYEALEELKSNRSKCIVTMVNSIDDYHIWENICGKGRILPAFPGAGGSIKDGVLDAALTPWVVQPTTFAELYGGRTERIKRLSMIFKKAHIPYQVVDDMHIWQLCHLAMVVPIADAYYEAENPLKVGKELKVMTRTARRLKRNFHFLKEHLGVLSPNKMNMFLFVPQPILVIGLSFVFCSSFGEKFMYEHSIKAPDEMRQLHRQFYRYVKCHRN